MPNIHYSTPYSTEKNFGKAINDFCNLIPENDWICIMDGDMLFLTPDWGRQIKEVVDTYGNTYSLFGCVTNRLGRPIQRHKGEFCENNDMMYHYAIAKEREEKQWSVVKDITRSRLVAGMLMLFSKKTWNKIKFDENTHFFDDRFSKKVVSSGGRLGLMEGLYVYHAYRLWSKDAKNDIIHLQNKLRQELRYPIGVR